MSLEEFLLNIHTSIYEYRNIITEDQRLQKVLIKLKDTGDIFACLKPYDKNGLLNHRSLHALKELGRYLIMEQKIRTAMIKQLVYPIILCILFAVQGFLFRSLGPGIFVTPIVIVMGFMLIQKNIRQDMRQALGIYWIICLLERTITIQEFLRIVNVSGFIHINTISSISELVFKVTGSSMTDLNILKSRYEDGMKNVIAKCEYSGDLLSKISTISIGFNVVYVMIKFAKLFV